MHRKLGATGWHRATLPMLSEDCSGVTLQKPLNQISVFQILIGDLFES